MNNKNLTRREFLDGATKTTLAATAVAAFGNEALAQDGGKPFVFQTSHGDLEIRQNPFALSLKNKSGKVLFETAPQAKRTGIGTANNFDKIGRGVKIQRTAAGVSVEAETADKQKFTLDISDSPNAITLEARANVADALALAFGYASDEHISGMGQRLRSLDLRGIQINSVARVNDDGTRTNNDEEFSAPLPFFLSNRGYSMFVETDCLWNFDFGKIDPNAISLQANGKHLKLHFFAGTTHKELIKKYTALTGRMARTADWNFGLWKWRDVYVDEFEVYQDAQMMRSMDLPTTAMIIDGPWSDKYIDFALNPRQFPSGKTFLDNLHKMNLKTVFWIVPFINPNASNFKFADEKGYFVKDRNGKTLLVDWWNPTSSVELGQGAGRLGGMIDFTFPEATRWWQSEVGKIVDAGCDGWKLDDGEFLPLEARMHDGRTGAEVKSAYSAMYEKAVFEVTERKKPGDYATMPARRRRRFAEIYDRVLGGRPERRFRSTIRFAVGDYGRAEYGNVRFSRVDFRHGRLSAIAETGGVRALDAVFGVLPADDRRRQILPRAVAFFRRNRNRFPPLRATASSDAAVYQNLRRRSLPRRHADYPPALFGISRRPRKLPARISIYIRRGFARRARLHREKLARHLSARRTLARF